MGAPRKNVPGRPWRNSFPPRSRFPKGNSRPCLRNSCPWTRHPSEKTNPHAVVDAVGATDAEVAATQTREVSTFNRMWKIRRKNK
jgi:hypothetical protein